jgi:hypothetical protein
METSPYVLNFDSTFLPWGEDGTLPVVPGFEDEVLFPEPKFPTDPLSFTANPLEYMTNLPSDAMQSLAMYSCPFDNNAFLPPLEQTNNGGDQCGNHQCASQMAK